MVASTSARAAREPGRGAPRGRGERIQDLRQRVAIVTGGGALARAAAVTLARRGADVALAGEDAQAAAASREAVLAAGGRALAVAMDPRERTSIQRMTALVERELGGVDILVNCTPVGGDRWRWDGGDDDADAWMQGLRHDVLGTAQVIGCVAEAMRRRAGGRVVNVLSIAGRAAGYASDSHTAAMAAAINVSQSWALSLAADGINVNAICVGFPWLHAPGDDPAAQRVLGRVRRETPLSRCRGPAEVGPVVAFLVSDRARNITGQTLNLCGGFRMG